MSTIELLDAIRDAGIVLTATGDRLTYVAPKGALTPALRDVIVQHKPALLALLAPPVAFVSLKRGLTVPVAALALALDLERRGVAMSLDGAGQFQVDDDHAGLSDDDRLGIARWRLHLGALIAYQAPTLA